jgi:hypothetical protein
MKPKPKKVPLRKLCMCRKARKTTRIYDWERCPLKNGGYTSLIVERCEKCGKVSGFPRENLRMAAKKGTEATKKTILRLIKDNEFLKSLKKPDPEPTIITERFDENKM